MYKGELLGLNPATGEVEEGGASMYPPKAVALKILKEDPTQAAKDAFIEEALLSAQFHHESKLWSA